MDSSRVLPPPQRRGNALAGLMKTNLRPIVLLIAFATGLWSFLWAVSSFRLAVQPNISSVPGLEATAFAMGVLYIVASLIQIFGLAATSMRNVNLVRIYAFGSIVSALCILAGSLTQVIVHFLWKTALINLCTSNTTGDTVFYNWGIWSPVTSTTLSSADAANWCNQAWTRGSWYNIISFLIELSLAVFFLFAIFGYYKQLQDPSSVANIVRPQGQYPLGAYPQQPYTGGYGHNPNFAPPQGPPPGVYGQGSDQPFAPPYDNTKLPEYDGTGLNYVDTKDRDGLLKNRDDDSSGDHSGDIGRGNSRR